LPAASIDCRNHAGRYWQRQAARQVWQRWFFRKAEWLDSGAGMCYNVAMAKQRKPVTRGAKVGGFVVGRAGFSKISAVEGIEFTPVMEKRASEADRKGLTAEEYRRTIVRSHRKG
jgi:hypothetical protein